MTPPQAAPTIKGIHHSAYRCRDAEETRRFYEGVLGLKTRAALAFEKDPAGQDRPYMHLFFEMADGNFIAFFDLPHTVHPKKFRVKDGMEDYHIAMELASMDDMKAFMARLKAHGVPSFGPINHHFCHSVYFFDPNGLALEFTVRDARHDEILDDEEAKADAIMKKWSAETALIRAERLKAVEAEERARKQAAE